MRNDRPKGNQSCMYTCMICKSENKNLKCHEEIVILNVFCVKWKSDLIVVLHLQREQERETERERGKKEERERGEFSREINFLIVLGYNNYFHLFELYGEIVT